MSLGAFGSDSEAFTYTRPATGKSVAWPGGSSKVNLITAPSQVRLLVLDINNLLGSIMVIGVNLLDSEFFKLVLIQCADKRYLGLGPGFVGVDVGA